MFRVIEHSMALRRTDSGCVAGGRSEVWRALYWLTHAKELSSACNIGSIFLYVAYVPAGCLSFPVVAEPAMTTVTLITQFTCHRSCRITKR